MPVGEMLARMSSAEITEWMAYERITGTLGGERDDVLMAYLAAVVANSSRGKRGKKFRPADFLPKWDRSRKPAMDWREMLAKVRQLNAQFGGLDLTKDGTDGGGAGGDGSRRASGPARNRRRRPHRRRR